ncbi:hypothetical protein F5Y10DRAFT_183272 [Nemania abortiva]|nr:hypothetical protein F5Y10DRAFT_183272 [Nemania abortiva]
MLCYSVYRSQSIYPGIAIPVAVCCAPSLISPLLRRWGPCLSTDPRHLGTLVTMLGWEMGGWHSCYSGYLLLTKYCRCWYC